MALGQPLNGRVYDATLGRFTTADPLIQAPSFSQSYHRYTYGFNNPLSGTDPSGFGFFDIAQDFFSSQGAIAQHCAACNCHSPKLLQCAAPANNCRGVPVDSYKSTRVAEAPSATIVEHGLSLLRIAALIIRRNAARLRPTGLLNPYRITTTYGVAGDPVCPNSQGKVCTITYTAATVAGVTSRFAVRSEYNAVGYLAKIWRKDVILTKP